jgi:hypothetical protein
MQDEVGVSETDQSAIRRCATDYIESWLDGDGERMRGCLHPALAKRAVYRDRSGTLQIDESPAEQMVELAAAGRGTKYGRGYEIEIEDAFRAIASVRVTSEPYVDIASGPLRWEVAYRQCPLGLPGRGGVGGRG